MEIFGESNALAHAILADCFQKGELTADEEIAMYEHIYGLIERAAAGKDCVLYERTIRNPDLKDSVFDL